MNDGTKSAARKASRTARITHWWTKFGCRKRTSVLAGCTLTSTSDGSISTATNAMGVRPGSTRPRKASFTACASVRSSTARPFKANRNARPEPRASDGRPTNPHRVIGAPPSKTVSAVTSNNPSAIDSPSTASTRRRASVVAGRSTRVLPSATSRNATSGRHRAIDSSTSSMRPSSVPAVRRNFRRAGTL